MLVLSENAHGIATLELENQRYTGFDTRAAGNQYLIKNIRKNTGGSGFIYKDENLIEWKIKGASFAEERFFIYGDHVDATPVTDIEAGTPEELINHIYTILKAYKAVDNQTDIHVCFSALSLLFLKNGGILVLPEKTSRELSSMRGLEYKRRYFDIYNHHDLENESRFTHGLSVFFYNKISGKSAFELNNKNDDEIYHRMQQKRFPSFSMIVPGLDSTLVDVLDRSLDSYNDVSCDEWLDVIESLKNKSIVQKITPEDKNKIIKQRSNFEKRYNKGFAIRHFLTRNAVLLTIAAGLGIFLIYLLSAPVNHYFAPRSTVDMTENQVVSLFYNSMKDLSFSAMEDCVVDKAGSRYINQITILRLQKQTMRGYGIQYEDEFVRDISIRKTKEHTYEVVFEERVFQNKFVEREQIVRTKYQKILFFSYWVIHEIKNKQ